MSALVAATGAEEGDLLLIVAAERPRARHVLGLLRATGILCVYGSGFGLPADQGFFRVVFLASPDELGAIYDDLAAFTREFLAAPGRPPRG